MAKIPEELDTNCISCESDDNPEDQDDTLEAEISKLEATLHELDDNDLLEFGKSAENLGDTDLYDDDNDNDPNLEIQEKTITNDVYVTDDAYVEITNNLDLCTDVAESDIHNEKQTYSATETLKTLLNSPSKNQINIFNEVPCLQEKTVESQATSRFRSKTGENEGSESPGSIASIESLKASENNTTSSEYLNIHPTCDDELEALLKSPVTQSSQIHDTSFGFSPFTTFQNNWFTSSPKLINSEQCQQSKAPLPSLSAEIQNKLNSLVSFPHQENLQSREQLDFKACGLGISELQSSSLKHKGDASIQRAVKYPKECKAEDKIDKASSDSVIILEERISEKVSNGSFLDLDLSRDYENEWLTTNEDGKCDKVTGPIASTPYRKRSFSFLRSKCSDFPHDGSFIVLDETGEIKPTENEKSITELHKDSSDSVQEMKCELMTVNLADNQEFNISLKHAAIVEHPSEMFTTDKNKTEETDDKKDEDYVKPIEIIKSDYLFRSEDPEENADNFNPEWELLRKLQTDEERYKAMRERWRNLVIPDPNLDLTHHTWRLQRNKSKSLPVKGTSEIQFMKPVTELRRKRTLSDPSNSSDGRNTKRSRTQSCTMLFDVKLQKLRLEIDSEQNRLYSEEEQAVQNLRNTQAMQQAELQNYYHGYQFMSQWHNLHKEYLQNEELIRLQYQGARSQAESAQEKKIQTLKKASVEVRAFHKFYQGLENKEDNDTSAYLSESQLDELWETEQFYEECEKFYSKTYSFD